MCEPPDAPSKPIEGSKEERKRRKARASLIRASHEQTGLERTERAAEILRAEGVPEALIRRQLKLKKRK